MVAVAERSRLPRAPHTDDFEKVMESPCPFHPKGKHAAKDCFTLKKYMEEHSEHPKYLEWSEAPITFDRLDHPEHPSHQVVIPWCWILLFERSSSTGC